MINLILLFKTIPILFIVILCLPYQCKGDEYVKPFANSFSSTDFDMITAKRFNPKIHFQSELGDGVGWQGMSQKPAFHVVLTVVGKDPVSQSQVAFPNLQLIIKSTQTLDCIIEQGNGDFESLEISSEKSLRLFTNKVGRISFSIPVSSIPSLDDALPPLLIQAAFMKKDHWIVGHLDGDLHHKMSKMPLSQMLELAPDLNKETGTQVLNIVHHLLGSTQGSFPSDETEHYLMTDGYQLQARDFSESKGKQGLYYTVRDNAQSTYMLQLPSSFKNDVTISRSLAVHGPLWKYKRSLGVLSNHTLPEELHNDAESLSLIASNEQWVLSGSPETSHRYFLTKRDGPTSTWKHRIIKTVEDAWSVVVHVFKSIGVGIKYMIHAFLSIFDWDKISHTVEFLSLYFQRISVLSFKGIDLVRDRYMDMLHNITSHTDGYFINKMKKMGVADASMESMQSDFNFTSKELPNLEFSKTEFKQFDAKTALIHDRVINNMPDMAVNGTLIQHMTAILKRSAASFQDAVDVDELKRIIPHKLKFMPHTSFRKMGMAQILNIARSLTLGSSQVLGNMYAGILDVLPAYWTLADGFFKFPIKIPFLQKFWNEKMFHGRSQLSLLDILCFLGGSYASLQYQVYYRGKGPFTELDIQVLSSSPDPQLFLYTWNHDPRTYGHGNKKIEEHRLGVYDWIPRCHQFVIWTTMYLLYDLPFIMKSTRESSAGSPGKNTYIAQFVNSAILEQFGPIANYPLTQLKTNDPVIVQNKLDNPDPNYLGFWYSWIIELFVRTIRTFLGSGLSGDQKNIWNDNPWYPIMDFALVCGPYTLFGINIQIESGKYVASNDYPRLAVLGIGWADVVSQFVNNLIATFIPGKYLEPRPNQVPNLANSISIRNTGDVNNLKNLLKSSKDKSTWDALVSQVMKGGQLQPQDSMVLNQLFGKQGGRVSQFLGSTLVNDAKGVLTSISEFKTDPTKFVIEEFVEEYRKAIKIGRDITMTFLTFARINIMIYYDISGMMSSGYQPDEDYAY